MKTKLAFSFLGFVLGSATYFSTHADNLLVVDSLENSYNHAARSSIPNETKTKTISFESSTFMEGATIDPIKFLHSVGKISKDYYEAGIGGPEELDLLLLPALKYAFSEVCKNNPDKAFGEFHNLEEMSYSLANKVRPSLIEYGLAISPDFVVNGLLPFYQDLNTVGRVVAAQWAKKNPLAAANWALSTLDENQRSNFGLDAALGVWVKNSPGEAQRWIESLNNSEQKQKAQSSLLKLLSEPGLDVIPIMNELANSLDSSGNAKSIQDALIKWEKVDSSAVSDWLRAQPDSPNKERIIQSVAYAKLINNSSGLNESLNEIPSREALISVVEKAADRLIMTNPGKPESAWNVISQLADSETRVAGFSAILNSGFNDFPSDPKRLKILSLVGKSMAQDPEATLKALQSVKVEKITKLRVLWSDLEIEKSAPNVSMANIKKIVNVLNEASPLPQ